MIRYIKDLFTNEYVIGLIGVTNARFLVIGEEFSTTEDVTLASIWASRADAQEALRISGINEVRAFYKVYSISEFTSEKENAIRLFSKPQ